MEHVIMFIVLFILVYLFYLLFVINKKGALTKMKKGKEFTLLKHIYKLDYTKLNIKQIANKIAIANAFILSFMTTIVTLLNTWISNFYLWLIVSLVMAFILMIPLTLIIYSRIGSYYQKKQKGVK